MPRVVVLGSKSALRTAAPAAIPAQLDPVPVETDPRPASLAPLGADAIVALEPSTRERELLEEATAPTILWHERAPELAAPRPNQRLIVAAGAPAAWRSLPLPVADAFFERRMTPPPGHATWLGEESERRRYYMAAFSHVEASFDDDPATGVAVNLHEGEEPAFEGRAARALATDRLLVSETLAPSRGIERGIDYLDADDLTDVFVWVENAARAPAAFERVRLRGRRKAELFRASTVIARLVHDLLLELAAPRGRQI